MRRMSVLCLLATVSSFLPSAARAGDLSDVDLSLRLPAAFSRFATYGDVAGAGGASAGSPWGTSVNPASIAWKAEPGKNTFSLSPQVSHIWFADGLDLGVYSGSFTWDTPDLGSFQPAFALIRSDRAQTRQGYAFRYDAEYYQMQYARKVGDSWAFGGSFNYTNSEARADGDPIGLGVQDLSKGRSDAYGFRLGALNQPAEGWLAGLVLDYAFSRDRTVNYAIPLLGLPETHLRDTTNQFLLRPGVSYEYLKDSRVYLDYQFGAFWNDTGSLIVNRFYTGVDHRVCQWLYLRAGCAPDTRGYFAWTAGVGVYPTDWFTIDVGYQFDMFPEIANEFGRSHTLTASVGIRF